MVFIKKFLKIICLILSVLSAFTFAAVFHYNNILPSSIAIYDDETLHFNTKLKIISKSNQKINSVSKQTQNSTQNYTTNLSLMGVVPIKSVDMKVVNRRYVTLSGESFGIKIFTKGVMVVGLSDIKTEFGSVNPAKSVGINSPTSCWSAASPWPTPWKSASRKVGPQGAGGGPEPAG